jgi:hypothetical protein
MRKNYMWVGTIPEIFGYGFSVMDRTEDLARKALKKAYDDFPDKPEGYADGFEMAFTHWGGFINKITLGEVYNDDFRK